MNPDPEKFALQPMFKNVVLICLETFLPAYKDKAEHDAESAKYFPEFSVTKSWLCFCCERWHFTGVFVKGSSGKHLADAPSLIDPDFTYPAPPKNFKPHVYKNRK